MRRRNALIGMAVVAAIAITSAALAAPAEQSASAKKTAKKALKQAKKAKRKAGKANKKARQANSNANTALAATTGPAGGDLTGNYPNPTVAANAIGGGEVADGSLTGADVDESSLSQVPDAATVDGTQIVPFNFAEAGVSPVTEILSLGGLILEAQCPDDTGSEVSLVAKTTVSDTEIRSAMTETNDHDHNDNDVESEDFDAGDVLDLFPDQDAGDQIGQIEYRHTSSVVSVSLQADADPGDCGIYGHAIYSAT